MVQVFEANGTLGVRGFVLGRPITEKLAAELRTAIGRSEFASGTLLPTSTELAAQHNVSAGTINHAITLIK